MSRVVAWRLLRWGLVAFWLAVIWQFGQSLVLPLSSAADVSRWLVRKGLHLAVYGVFGGVLVLAVGSRRHWMGILVVCLLVAFGDELHQNGVPQRSFNNYDLGIDLVGAMFGTLLTKRVVDLTMVGREDNYFGI